MPKKFTDTMTASKIGEYVFCAESWRLAQLGHKPCNQRQRDDGTQHHREKATVERAAGSSIALGRILIIAALIALAVWALSR